METNPATIAAVESAALYWCKLLGSKASRLYPTRHDFTEMVAAGVSLVDWLRGGVKILR